MKNKQNKQLTNEQLLKKEFLINEINNATINKEKIDITQHFKDPIVLAEDGKNWVKASEIFDKYNCKTDMMNDAYPQSINPYGSAPGTMYFNQLNNTLVNNFFLGYAEYAILLQNPMLNKICTILANEITSKWIEFVYVDSDEQNKNNDKLKELEKEFEKFRIKELFYRCAFLMFGYGGCMLYPKLKGDEELIGGTPERENPFILDEAKFNKGDLEYFKIIEPQYYTPIRWVADDPLNEYFYVPEYYTVLGKVVHSSRMMKFINNELPDLLKPSYMFNGLPITQLCAPYVQGWESCRNDTITTVSRLNLFKFGANMESNIDDFVQSQMTASASLPNRIRGIVATLKNGNILTYDKENEEIDTINLNLGGLSDINYQQLEYISAISGIVATKLLGTPPRGMNSTGEHDMNNFYDIIRNYQQNNLETHLTTAMHYIMINKWGQIDENITFRWNNLEEANKLEESEIRLKTAQEASLYVNSGAVMPLQVAKKLANEEDSGWDMLEINEKDYERAQEVEHTSTNKNKLGETENKN